MFDPQLLILLVVTILLATVVVAFIWLNRRLNFKSGPTHHTQTDLANMMILFQTMRDVLAEQKDLARQFNASLDDKVTVVRKLVDAARDEREAIRDAQTGIADIVKQTKNDLAALQQSVITLQAGLDASISSTQPEATDTPPVEVAEQAPEHVVEESPEEPATTVEPTATAEPTTPVEPTVPSEPTVPVEPIAETAAATPDANTDSAAAVWTGADFRQDFPEVQPVQLSAADKPTPVEAATPETIEPAVNPPASKEEVLPAAVPTPDEPAVIPMRHAFELPKQSPVAPEDSAASRNAFRQLLSLEPAAQPMASDPFGRLGGQPKPGNGGSGNLTPVQRRVYEYSDAGMRVPEIARELGVGKGEVRLILSLRKSKQR